MEQTATITQTPRYIVMTSSAHMPSSCWGRYINVAIVKLQEGFVGTPKMISTHARGVASIVRHYGPCHVGITDRCESAHILKVAKEEATRLTAQTE